MEKLSRTTKTILSLGLFLGMGTLSWADCPQMTGDTLYYDLGNGCTTVAAAVSDLTGNAAYYAGGALQTNVVFLLPAGSSESIDLSNFNASGTGKQLVVRSADAADRATLTAVSLSGVKDVRIENCRMALSGGTGLSLLNSRSIVLLNNEIEVALPAPTPVSDVALSVSGCQNIQLLRNSLRGAHASLLRIANTTGLLAMNNILWSDNANASAACPTALVRFDGAAGAVSQIGFYYNTLFVAPGTNTAQPVDFFAFGNYATVGVYGHQANYVTSSIALQYNNCYSYSETVPGRTANAFVVRTDNGAGTLDLLDSDFCKNIRYNNFWSKFDAGAGSSASAFAFGCESDLFVSAAANACAANPTTPSALVVTGSGLDLGYSITKDMSGMAVASGVSNDWSHSADVRPRDGAPADPSELVPDLATIVLVAASTGATASHAIDLSGFHMGDGTTVTASLTGAGAANFALSRSTVFTADANGDIATDSTIVTFTGPAADGEYEAAVHYTFSVDDATMSFDVPLVGVKGGSMGSGWTLGACQKHTGGGQIAQIVWKGTVNSDWDERANWVNPDNGRALTCADDLSPDLSVVVPAGAENYPVVPDFTVRSVAASEQVNASNSKFASVLNTEYGASLRGVEHLSGHYDYAVAEFTAPRSEWVLVGPVVHPFESGTSGEVRNLMSADFYLNDLPRVYMHQAEVNGNSASWGEPFNSMYENLDDSKVFAINVMNHYGQYKLTANSYYQYVENDPSKRGDGTVPKTFVFTGKYVNESALPSYTVTAGEPNLLCNTYPANINLDEVSATGTFQVYDYGIRSFRAAVAGDKIKSQEGFVFTPGAGTSLDLTAADFDGSPTTRRAASHLPGFFVSAQRRGSTLAGIAGFRFNEGKADGEDLTVDAPKVFNTMEAELPDVYVAAFGKAFARIDVNDGTQLIPLGIRLQKAVPVVLSAWRSEGLDQVVLEDRATGAVYDLTAGDSCVVEDLEAGDNAGRFFLRMAPMYVIGGDGTTTEVDEAVSTDKVYFYQQGNAVVISSDEAQVLQRLTVADMTGRSSVYPLDAHYNRIELPLAPGTYLMQVATGRSVFNYKVIVR